jgi:hypothetical protein
LRSYVQKWLDPVRARSEGEQCHSANLNRLDNRAVSNAATGPAAGATPTAGASEMLKNRNRLWTKSEDELLLKLAAEKRSYVRMALALK